MPTLDYERPPARDDRPNRRPVARASLGVAAGTLLIGMILHHVARADGSSRLTAQCFGVVVLVGGVGFLLGLIAIVGEKPRRLGLAAAIANLAAAAIGGMRLAMLA